MAIDALMNARLFVEVLYMDSLFC